MENPFSKGNLGLLGSNYNRYPNVSLGVRERDVTIPIFGVGYATLKKPFSLGNLAFLI